MFSCFDVLSSLELGIQTEHFPNLIAVVTKLGGGAAGASTAWTQQLIQYIWEVMVCRGLQYYTSKFKSYSFCGTNRRTGLKAATFQ